MAMCGPALLKQHKEVIMDKWDERWIEMAKLVSSWSKDPRWKIGAIVVRDRQLLSIGYNGFPRDIADTHERLSNRESKRLFTIHAEKNAIYNAVHNGINLTDATIYVYGLPTCSECMKGIIQSGINRVVAVYPNDAEPKYIESSANSAELAKLAVVVYDEVLIGGKL
jgi:dCMP deaminase